MEKIINLFCFITLIFTCVSLINFCNNTEKSNDDNNEYVKENIEDMSLWNSIISKINDNKKHIDNSFVEVTLMSTSTNNLKKDLIIHH